MTVWTDTLGSDEEATLCLGMLKGVFTNIPKHLQQ